ncbi:MAG: STIV orfB116 family protein [Pirellulales bacterium]
MFIANAFSLQMLATDATVSIETVDIETAQAIAVSAESAIGHADTAAVVSDLLGTNLAANRVNVNLNKGDQLLVAQVMGGRLPEGATTLPDGMKIAFKLVTVRTEKEEQLFRNLNN